MAENIDQGRIAIHREIKDLEAAIQRQDPPLVKRVRDIAIAKIAKLRRQIRGFKIERSTAVRDKADAHERL